MAKAWQAAHEDGQLLLGAIEGKGKEMDGAIAASRRFKDKVLNTPKSSEHPQQLYIAWNLELASLAEGAQTPLCLW